MIDFQYWYVFPIAVCVATLCNASGFSGSVLFQPFFNFILQVPIAQSVATVAPKKDGEPPVMPTV